MLFSIEPKEPMDDFHYIATSPSPVVFLGRAVRLIYKHYCRYTEEDRTYVVNTHEKEIMHRNTDLIKTVILPKLKDTDACHDTALEVYKCLSGNEPESINLVYIDEMNDFVKSQVLSKGNCIFHFDLGDDNSIYHSFVIEKVGFNYRLHQSSSFEGYSYLQWVQGLEGEESLSSITKQIKYDTGFHKEENARLFFNSLTKHMQKIEDDDDLGEINEEFESLFDSELPRLPDKKANFKVFLTVSSRKLH